MLNSDADTEKRSDEPPDDQDLFDELEQRDAVQRERVAEMLEGY